MTSTPHNRIDLIRPDAPELAARGPWPVGVRRHDLVNPAQLDVLTGATGDRVLVVEEWYPAIAGTGGVLLSLFKIIIQQATHKGSSHFNISNCHFFLISGVAGENKHRKY